MANINSKIINLAIFLPQWYELTEKDLTRSCLCVCPSCGRCCKIQSIIEKKERAVLELCSMSLFEKGACELKLDLKRICP